MVYCMQNFPEVLDNVIRERKELMTMNMTKSEWRGFERLDLDLGARKATLICPKTPREDSKWIYKTEYLTAFPSFDLHMLNRGYYIAHLQNTSRWCPEEDTDMRPIFCDYLIKNFGLHKKCMLEGMSCGGMQAVYFASKYPEYVAAVYLDAPVLNLLSCPYALGKATTGFREEFEQQMGMTLSELLNYRKHPIDEKDKLLQSGIPVFLICGDSDLTVPYTENGKILSDYFKAHGGNLTEILKPGCDHHPHGLDDPTPLIEFTKMYY